MLKRIFMLTILLVGILAVGAVCAADNSTSDIVGADTVTEDVMSVDEIDDDSIGVGDSHIIGDEPKVYGFDLLARDIVGTAPGGVLNITCDYRYEVGDSPIVIEKPITIKGNGHFIDANHSSRIFQIKSDYVYINNLVFLNGESDDEEGGAIYWNGYGGIVNGCSFVNCTSGKCGGAIYLMGTEIMVSSCKFINNGAGHDGGAIYFDGFMDHLYDCEFTDNSAIYGGALFLSQTSKTDIGNCYFHGGYAEVHGGAIYFNHSSDNSVSNCNFIDNDADGNGGAISANCSDFIGISTCHFVNNSAFNFGGAISCEACPNATVSECYFENNYAPLGGAIFQINSSGESVKSCYFTKNRATSGSVYYAVENVTGPSAIFRFNNNILLNNGDDNSEFYLENSTCHDMNYNWFGNNATDYKNNLSEYGDVWLFLNATLDADSISVRHTANVTFLLAAYNSTSGLISGYDNSLMYPVELTVNSTLGSLANRSRLAVPVTYAPKDVGVDNITASLQNAKCTIPLEVTIPTFFDLNQTINGNWDSEIYLDSDYRWVPSDVNFTYGIGINRVVTIYGNNFTIDGAGQASIFDIWQCDGTSINNVTFINAKSNNDQGGAIYMAQVTCSIVNCTFINNWADEGGAIKGWYANYCSIIDCLFINNTADNGGGAIMSFGNYSELKNCSFINNHAASGGAVKWWFDSQYCSISDCYFENNSADEGGAVIFPDIVEGSVSNSCFVNNRANDGGAISISGKWQCSVYGSDFVSNNAYTGGAISHYGKNALVSNCRFANNNAGMGSVYYKKDTAYGESNSRINNNIILNNTGCEIFFNKANASNIDYNWFGNNASNYNVSLANVTGIALNSWYFLDINLTSSLATLRLNNLYNVKNDTAAIIGDCNISGVNLALAGVNLKVPKTATIQNGTSDVPIHPQFNDFSMTAGLYTASYTKSAQIGDFDALQNKIIDASPNSVIELDRNYTYTEVLDGIVDGIEVNLDNVTIRGNGFSINATGKSRIFVINGFNVTIENLTFLNANGGNSYERMGGAIHWNGNYGSLYNCTFKANDGKWGGAVTMMGNNSSIQDCSFINNTASSISGAYGGAIYVGDAVNTSISCSHFENNHAASDGGAFYTLGSENISISNSTFVNCWSDKKGGAIALTTDNCSVSGCYFAHNHGAWAGAILLDYAQYCSVSGCYFVNNSADVGGAVAVSSSSWYSVSGCYFTNNTAGNAHVYYDVNFGLREGAIFNNNILLNNNGDEIFFENPSQYNTDNNWFGNNASNHDNSTRGFVAVWLFLNATADPNEVQVSNSSNITFKLYVYDSTSNTTRDYDNSLLMPVNLTIASKLGGVDKKLVGLNDTFRYTANEGGTGSVTASIENVKFTVELNVSKIDSNLSAEPVREVSYGENATIALNYNRTATGTVNITLQGKKHEYSYPYELNATIVLPGDILPDDYNVTVTYSGDNRFLNATADSTLTVKKLTTVVNVTSHDIKVSDIGAVMFEIALPENVCGNMTIAVNENASTVNATKVGKKENGHLIVNLTNDGLAIGKYGLKVTYDGDDVYDIASANATSSILIVKTEIVPANETMNLIVDDDSKVAYTLSPADAKGNVTFSSSDSNVVEVDSAGNVRAIAKGQATISVRFSGSENYTASSATVKVTVSKAESRVSANPVELVEGEIAVLSVNLSDGATGKVFVEFDGIKFYGDVDNGTASVSIICSVAGNYTANIVYSGDNKFNSSNATVGIKVNVPGPKEDGNLSATPLEFVEGESAVLSVKLASATAGIVFVDVGGIRFYGDVEDGNASVVVSGLAAGNYTAVVVYSGDDRFRSSNATVAVRVDAKPDPKVDSSVSACPVELVEGETAVILVNVTEGATGIVLVDVGSSRFYGNVDNGNASVTVSGLAAGNYTAVVVYSGDDRFRSSNATVAVRVDAKPEHKLDSSVSAGPVELVEGETAVILVNVTEGATGVVLVDVGSSRFYGNVGNGKSSVMIFGLTAGNYTAVIAYAGDDNFKPSNTTVAVKVDAKPAPKFASSIAITEINSNNITAILKDANGNGIAGVEVNYTINSNTSSVVTAADGSFVVEAQYDVAIFIAFGGDNNTQSSNSTITVKYPTGPTPVKVESRFDIPGGSITINGYAIDTKAGEEGIAYATRLLDANGNPISNVFIQFGVNNKIYNRTTYENGSFKPYHLDMSRAGRYTMAFSYGGNDQYNSTFAVVCVDLDKKPMKIKAGGKSYKASAKNKKYTVTLSTIAGSSADGMVHMRSGLKVTMKVNGKTYTGKTDNNGKVTFKITNLSKRGKFTAVINYEGDSTYEAASKTVKLTVK